MPSLRSGSASWPTSSLPPGRTGPCPTRAAQPARDLVRNGRLDRQDLDIVRGDWYTARQSARPCGVALSGDTNSDGCTDAVDLQAQLAAQGQATAAPAAPMALAALNLTFAVTSTADTPDAATRRRHLRRLAGLLHPARGDDRGRLLPGRRPHRVRPARYRAGPHPAHQPAAHHQLDATAP